jgi:sortase A
MGRLRRLVTIAAVGVLLGAPTASATRAPSTGFRLGTLTIAKLGVTVDVIQGTRESELIRGVGHYRITALPGSKRTVAIAGHRTTYDRPFHDLDRLRAKDRVVLTMWHGKRYVYEVMGSRIVSFDDWSILANKGYEKLVLTTCHPPGSATYRLVVFARLVSPR